MMKEFGKTIISITLIFWLFLGSPNKLFSIPENKHDEPPIVLECRLEPIITHQIGRYIHSVFGGYYGNVIYDGIWVGRDSPISNIDGLRKDVIEGCKEAGIAAFRWPGGCCADPYNVKICGIGNTDENVWHIDFNNPIAYAQNFLRWKTAILDLSSEVKLIGLGLSWRHGISGWVESFLDYVTQGQTNKGPDSLSIHHYIGGKKDLYKKCGPAVGYPDEAYYFIIQAIQSYQKDIDLYRSYIKNHTSSQWPTTISFDEWGLWHPEATVENGFRQPQTMRDAIFAALSLHAFYRNSDIVEYAMETQITNLLQSLFETDGARFYKTPTFYVYKLYKNHQENYLFPLKGWEKEPMIDCVGSISDDLKSITLSLMNKHLQDAFPLEFPKIIREKYLVRDCRIIAPAHVRA